ncbi:hypothetical protein [Vreelandella zhaodongensis]|uniref:Uncharacterized protein n=1 Tax=Vreelandella zhaodongensis TaxID=1176240 RepID=A0ABX2STS3_VREZH|nr:hypothetical protein [Halomonas zhaodongensis]NYS45518.1 hypothetical protein [Halomonas zhaodongensis]
MSKQEGHSAWIRWRNRFRLYLSISLAILALINAAIKFWGEWELFLTAILGHIFFGQLIVAFLYDKNMNVGGGGADLSDGSVARGMAITFAVIGYGVMFLFNGYPWQ